MIEKSGWKLKSILGLHIHIIKYDPINGSSYIELPFFYKKKKSLVNVLNDDNMCGKWAITISLNPSRKDVGRVTKDVKEKSEKYDWTGVKFPLTVEGIKIFEQNNKNIGIICYTPVEDSGKNLSKITPLWISKKSEYLPDENLAKIFVIKGHYCVVTNESGFLNNGEKNEIEVCRRCGYKVVGDSRYSVENRLKNHLRYCNQHDYCKETFPNLDKRILEFKRWDAVIKHPIMIIFDFECLLKKCEKGEMKNTKK